MKEKTRQEILNQEMAEARIGQGIKTHSTKGDEIISPAKNKAEADKLSSQFIADIESAYEGKPIHIVMTARVYTDDYKKKTTCLVHTNSMIEAEMIIDYIKNRPGLMETIIRNYEK